MTTRTRSGQAIIELTLGLFALALVLSAFFYLVRYLSKSLKIQNQLRSANPVFADSIELDAFARKEVFGLQNLHISEPHGVTDRTIRQR